MTLDRPRRIKRVEQRSFLVAPLLTVVRSVFPVAFPSDCRICSLPLTNISRFPVSEEGLDSIEPVRAPQCLQCGGRLLLSQLLMGDGRCHGCREFEPEFDRAASFGEYAGALRGIIHLLKYDGVLPAMPVLRLHSSKRGERGSNLADLIVRWAAKRLSQRLEVATVLKPPASDVFTDRIVPRRARRQMRGAFRVADFDQAKGRTVIVVDEVMTTGTTVSERARVLKKAGAERVWAASVARTLKKAAMPVSVERGKKEEGEAAEIAVSV